MIGVEVDPVVDKRGERKWLVLYEGSREVRGDFDANKEAIGMVGALVASEDVDESFATNSDEVDPPAGVLMGTMGIMRGRDDAPEDPKRCEGAALFLIGVKVME